MRNLEISGILCSAEIDLNGILTVGNVTEINWTSKTRKFRGNVTEILMEIVPEIPLLPEITRKFRKEMEIPVAIN